MWSLAASGVNFAGSGSNTTSSVDHTHVTTEFINAADGNLDMKNFKITNLSTPTENNDASNKRYVDTSKHNLTSNLVLNSNQLWLTDDNSSRIQSIQGDDFNGAMIVAPSGLLISTGTESILTASPTSIFVNNKRITSVADPTNELDASNKQYVDSKVFAGDMKNKRISNLADPSNETDATNKQYVDNALSFSGDMKNKRISNLADPINKQDAVTLFYLLNRYNKPEGLYDQIKNQYKPTFWISSKFPFGLTSQSTIQDLSGNGLTVSAGSLDKNLNFTTNTTLQSSATYGTTFTFFIKAKRTSDSGRLFTSSSGNKVFGWWDSYIKCAWMDGEIYGIGSHLTAGDKNIHTYILTNNNDAKKFYEDKTEIAANSGGTNTWGNSTSDGKVVLGKPTQQSSEAGSGQIYEVMCFDKVLTETEIFDIYDKIFITTVIA